MWIRSITLVAVLALWLPCSSRADSHYAQSVWQYTDGVSNWDYALGKEDEYFATLEPQAYIELNMMGSDSIPKRFGDVCAVWDIKIYIGQSQPNNIEVWLCDVGGTWKLANVLRTSPIAHADMARWACFNIGKRWQYIRVKNIDNVSITLNAVENCYDPAPKSSALSSAYAVDAEPYPEDLCECDPAGSVQSPVLGPTGIILLATGLMLSGGIAVRILRRRQAS